MRFLTTAIIASTLAISGYAFACPGKDKGEDHQKVTAISVDDAAKAKKAGKVIMVDANSDSTRKSQGVVPGAKLLTSYSEFDADKLNVSKDDTLVFYCYNEKCSAAPKAAKLAKSKGFMTKVMEAGIMGWKKAGHAVTKI